jgi:uncharacterized repeat protein (TIGR03803 family)
MGVATQAQAANETVLHNFGNIPKGANPVAGVISDSTGDLYGTTSTGGIGCGGNTPPGCGVVYKLDPTGHETVLYSFTGGTDGSNPDAGVTLDSAGNLYGTTPGGGISAAGVVYKLDTAGQETVLYSFTGALMGATPTQV